MIKSKIGNDKCGWDFHHYKLSVLSHFYLFYANWAVMMELYSYNALIVLEQRCYGAPASINKNQNGFSVLPRKSVATRVPPLLRTKLL